MANTGKSSKSGSSTRSRSTSGSKSTSSSSGRKKSSTTKRKPTQSEIKREREMFREVGIYIFLAVMVFLFLCNFKIIGPLGDAVSGFMFGLVGLVAYVFPIYLFWLITFWYANPGNSYAKRKIFSTVAIFMVIQMVCQLFANGKNGLTEPTMIEVFKACKEGRNGGGIIAGSLAFFIEKHLGVIGLILILLLIALIALIFLTEKSLIRSVRDGSDKLKEKRREESERQREIAEIRQQEKEERRLRWEEQRAEKEEERRRREEERQQQEEERAHRRELEREEEQARRTKPDPEFDEEDDELEPDLHVFNMKKGRMTDKPSAKDKKKEPSREEIREAKEDQKTLRMHRKHNGIIFDTDMSKEYPEDRRRDDVHEITWNEEEDFEFEEQGSAQTDVRQDESQPHVSIHRGGTTERVPLPTEPVFEPVSTFEEADVKPRDVVRKPEPVVKPDPVVTTREEDDIQPVSRPSSADQRPKAVLPTKTAEEKEHEEQQSLETVDYQFPSIDFLKPGKKTQGDTSKTLQDTAQRLQQTLQNFGVKVTITDISQGPSVTRYELQPEQGVKVSKIVNLADDIKLNLAATDIRIEAPIPGKAAIGIEVPNKENSAVALRDLIEAKEFEEFSSNLAFAVGKNIAGEVVVWDIAKMPHVLIAGATGSGKSVCINTIIMSILYKAKPDDVRLIMIDPKVVELSVYNGIPHLLIPVVTDPKKASGALHWGVAEMTERYKKFADFNVRDLKGYNKEIEAQHAKGENLNLKKLPQIVIIVDELADLMMVCPGEVEESICRLAQLARAAGIHLIIATQRPSVDVITGLIKANMPSRIAFSVSSGVDSRTILDMNGAEKLLGKGDMLFAPYGASKPSRIQGAFVSDEEVSDVVDFLKNQKLHNVYHQDLNIEEQIANASSITGSAGSGGGDERDEYFAEAGRLIIDKDKASIGMLQRQYKIGFNRAARIMDQLCDYGVVGEEEGTKPRKVLMSMEQFEQLLDEI